MPRFLSGISRNILILGLVSFLNDVSSEMIFAVLPIYLATVVGLDAAAIGLIEGFAEASSNVAKLFSGRLSDFFGSHKPLAIVGYALSTLTKPFFALATTGPAVLLVRTADRVGKGIRTAPRDALIADSVDTANRGKAFGLHRSLDTAGAVVGPLLAIVLLPLLLYDYRTLFMLSIVPGILTMLVLIWFVKDLPRKKTAPRKQHITLNWNLLHPHLTEGYRRALVVASVFALGNFSFVFLMLRLSNFGIAASALPVAYLFFNLVYLVVAAPVGAWSDKIGRRTLLVLGYGVFALLCFLAASDQLFSGAAFVLVALYGVFTAVIETMQRAFVVDLVPKGRRATALGTYFGTVGILALPASAIAGFLWQSLGAGAAFSFSAVIAILSAGMLLVWFPMRPSRAA
jgi:MFS family permease